ncbi:MAG: STY4534 family ICE replication protein [Proteobacteria bacterium]|nr:STY4534 family ICE replication protein [Pseudomonadota bacterium]
MSENTASTEKKYFDLHTLGLGYLNRAREVKPNKGEPYLACVVNALNGEADDVKYVPFDCRVSGEKAQELVRSYFDVINAKGDNGKPKNKVLVGFRVGDLWTDIFTYEKGEKAGKQGVSLKVRLLYIGWIKVNGQVVYKAEPKPKPENEQTTGATPTDNADEERSTGAPDSESPSAQDGEEAETEISGFENMTDETDPS